MISNNFQSEIDGYVRIIEQFQAGESENRADEIWKYQSYIKFNKSFERNHNKSSFSNKILLLLALSDDLAPDRYHAVGESVADLSNNKRNEVCKILKNEFQLGEN